MASLKCSFCGHGIHYHGEPPDGTEYIFCKISDWEKIEEKNLPSDDLESENKELLKYAWKCSECGTFAFFDERGHVTAVYTPKKENSSDVMNEPKEFGVFFDDYLWYEITEDDISASEVLKKYPQNLWLLKNEDEMRIFKDREMKNCVDEYERIKVEEE